MSQCLLDSHPFLRIKCLQENKISLFAHISLSFQQGIKPTKVFVKKSTAIGFAFGNSCANGRRFRKGSARI